MKLELKHIAPYLPYNVQCSYQEFPDEGERITANLTHVSIKEIETTTEGARWSHGGLVQGDVIAFEGRNNIQDLKFKLHLRPISQLTEEIEHNGERFVPVEKLSQIQWEFQCDAYVDYFYCHDDQWKDANLQQAPFEIAELLFECNFDVFDLIPKGLAIPKTN